ncbi:bestrophin family protein [Synechococcus sp. CCY 9618]|uniref:bestrophin family protein n=1 Tax=Synechococcus sp. CCY 9618 TaxID=2815602 RepID=UPI0020B24591|nr:bestrophin family ion channel [Synechococcus sp. CCY 9618]
MMITDEKLGKADWASTIAQIQGSILPAVLPRVLVFCGLATIISGLHASGFPIYLEKLGDLTTNVIYNLVLGLLVVFRTNTSYDRFWEGRKAWGALVVNIRNLAQELQVGIANAASSSEKQAMIRLLSAFAIATRLHLRNEDMSDELKALITPIQAQQLEISKHRPLVIIFWIRHYLQTQLSLDNINDNQLTAANTMLGSLVEGITGCERIITTPIPIAYRVFLKRLILIYCIGLPFRIVPDIAWWSIPMMAFISFLLLGVEEVGRELENPFGYHANDLPLDDICSAIINNVESTLTLGVQFPPEQASPEALSSA